MTSCNLKRKDKEEKDLKGHTIGQKGHSKEERGEKIDLKGRIGLKDKKELRTNKAEGIIDNEEMRDLYALTVKSMATSPKTAKMV